MNKPTSGIPLGKYAQEILEDLPELMENNPQGILISQFCDFYGETTSRTYRACRLLSEAGKITLFKTSSNAFRVLPFNETTPDALLRLSIRQRRLVKFFVELCEQKFSQRIKTDYSQLSRLTNCSYVGLRSNMVRLEQLGYIKIEISSVKGKQGGLIVVVQDHLMDLAKASMRDHPNYWRAK